jgi:hypothetical protein
MSDVRVNRDKDLERAFWEYKKSNKGDSTRMDALWSIWLTLKRCDLKHIKVKSFKLIQAVLQMGGLHFYGIKEEEVFFEYVKWFAENRIINTGSHGLARCEKNPTFVREKD